MPPANGIFYSLSSALCLRTCIPRFYCSLYGFLKYPDGLYLCFDHLCEPRSFYVLYSIGVTLDKNSNKITSSKSRSELKGNALKKWESTLNLRVHAHGCDVELIMKASCKSNCPLGGNSSCFCDLLFYLEYYPSGISMIWWHCTTSYEFLLV